MALATYNVCLDGGRNKLEGHKMFKPEYLIDNVALFGARATVTLIENKFIRMGKNKRMARIMAYNLLRATIGKKNMVF